MSWNTWKTELDFLNKKDLHTLSCYSSIECQQVEGKAWETLLRIEQWMRHLKPMGDDELRRVWLPVNGRASQWLLVESSEYDGRHYVMLRLNEEDNLLMANITNYVSRRYTYLDTEVAPLLSHVEQFVAVAIKLIEADAEGYNQFLEKNLNPAFRTGTIERKVLEGYTNYGLFDDIDKEAALAFFKNPPAPHMFDKLTLREYLRMRRLAHEAIYGVHEGTDQEVLCYSPGVRQMQAYDLDNEEGFNRWKAEVSYCHGLDVIYARLHLAPRDASGKKVLVLWANTIGHLSNYIVAAMGMAAAGYAPLLDNVDRIVRMLEGTDKIRITPHPTYYLSYSDVNSEAILPSKAELGAKRFNELVKLVQWEPLEKVLPLEDAE